MTTLKTLRQICFHRSKFLQPTFHLQKSLHCTTHQELDPTISYISSDPLISLLGICKNVSSLKELHSLLIVDGHTHSTQLNLQTKLLNLYVSLGDMKNARLVFDQMPNPDMFSRKTMIRLYFINNQHLETIAFYTCSMKCLKEHDNVVFSIVVKACTKLQDVNQGKKVHCDIVKTGGPDSFVLTSLVDMYAKCGDVNSSRRVFDEIIDQDVVSWTSMIVSYVQNSCGEEALMLFNKMSSEFVNGNEHTFGSIVSACTKLKALHQGRWVHGNAIKNGFDHNSHLVSSLVDMYAKCGAILDARSLFDEVSCVDLVTWTAMIVGYSQSGYPNEAISLFMDRIRIFSPNSVTISSVVSACTRLSNPQLGKAAHCIGVKLGLEDGNVKNALIDMYAKCEMIKEARFLFDSVTKKDLVTWNSIINGYAQIGCFYEVTRLFNQMRLEGFSPDAHTLVTLLSCFSYDLRVGSSLHGYCIKELVSAENVYIGTALVHFYARSGKLRTARKVFDEMPERNTVSWNAMINGYGTQGDCNGLLTVFNNMINENLNPNDATFTSILSACSHTGTEGWEFFESMCKEFGIVPQMSHYGCLVDMLARSGKLEEAYNFIKKMPVRPDVTLLGSFLHGCSMHSRFDLGQTVVKWMFDFDQNPVDSSYYVLVSNLYASDGRWNEVFTLRELMNVKKFSKFPGYSSGFNHAAPYILANKV